MCRMGEYVHVVNVGLAQWVIVYVGQLIKITEITHIFGLLFSTVKVLQSY
jgi:hypothetical protein